MTNLADKTHLLKSMINDLLKYKEKIDLPFRAFCEQYYKIVDGEASKENLRKIFILSIQARGGPKLSNSQCRKVLKEFDLAIDDILELNLEGKQKVDELVNRIFGIHGIGPKITCVFLRDVVYHFHIWPDLVNYLYQPIDRHVQTILTKKLKVMEEKEVPQPSKNYFFAGKNQRFQSFLSEVHQPRIEFDYLWHVGAHFCIYRISEICGLCPIIKYCKNPYE